MPATGPQCEDHGLASRLRHPLGGAPPAGGGPGRGEGGRPPATRATCHPARPPPAPARDLVSPRPRLQDPWGPAADRGGRAESRSPAWKTANEAAAGSGLGGGVEKPADPGCAAGRAPIPGGVTSRPPPPPGPARGGPLPPPRCRGRESGARDPGWRAPRGRPGVQPPSPGALRTRLAHTAPSRVHPSPLPRARGGRAPRWHQNPPPGHRPCLSVPGGAGRCRGIHGRVRTGVRPSLRTQQTPALPALQPPRPEHLCPGRPLSPEPSPLRGPFPPPSRPRGASRLPGDSPLG